MKQQVELIYILFVNVPFCFGEILYRIPDSVRRPIRPIEIDVVQSMCGRRSSRRDNLIDVLINVLYIYI